MSYYYPNTVALISRLLTSDCYLHYNAHPLYAREAPSLSIYARYSDAITQPRPSRTVDCRRRMWPSRISSNRIAGYVSNSRR